MLFGDPAAPPTAHFQKYTTLHSRCVLSESSLLTCCLVPPQYMEIVAHGYLGYGEAQHSVDKLVNMTCERGPGGSAGKGGRFEHSGGSPHSYGLESPCQLLCSVAKCAQRGDFRS